MNGPSREEMNAKIAAASAENAAQIAKLDAKLDRIMAEMHTALAQMRLAMAEQLKWTVGLVCLIVALSMSTLGLMMRGYVDDAVRKAIDEKIQVQKSTALAPPAHPHVAVSFILAR